MDLAAAAPSWALRGLGLLGTPPCAEAFARLLDALARDLCAADPSCELRRRLAARGRDGSGSGGNIGGGSSNGGNNGDGSGDGEVNVDDGDGGDNLAGLPHLSAELRRLAGRAVLSRDLPGVAGGQRIEVAFSDAAVVASQPSASHGGALGPAEELAPVPPLARE